VKFGFMKVWRRTWSVVLLCHIMQVTARGFHKWLTRPMNPRQRGDLKVLAHIRKQKGLSLGSYGRKRMTMELKEAGLDVGERRVGRLMKINGIKPVRTRKYKVTANSNHNLGIVPNALDGSFTANAPNCEWAGDCSYIWTAQGWLYLAVILDLQSRRVVGWAVNDRMKNDLAIQALDMAVRLRNPPEGCVFHSDRSSKYCSYNYQKRL
jgi:putative transposase